MNKEEKLSKFLQEAKEKFPQFDYSKVLPFNNQEKEHIIIICPEHGEFKTTPRTLIKGKYGCPICARILKGRNSRSKINDVINKSPLPELNVVKSPIIVLKEKLIGTVYCFINKINNKLYIGETVKSNYEERFSEHRNKAERGINNYFYKAIRKYGWDNFDKVILFQTEILENTEENKKYLNNIVNQKEVYYINKYKTTNHNFGYNLTNGGDGIVGYKHSEETKKKLSESHKGEKHWKFNKENYGGDIILQFDLDFNFIQEWPSMSEIERQTGYKSNNISRCCNNKLDTYKNYIWVKKEEYFEGYLQKYKSRAKCKSSDKSVLQYDFFGNFIDKYISCAEAGKKLGRKTVNTAANGRDPQLYGYIWIYEEDFSEELLAEKLDKVKNTQKYKSFIKKLKSENTIKVK